MDILEPERLATVINSYLSEMALRMRERVTEHQNYWRKQGVPKEIQIRMGIATGHCTVGHFGSEQRLDYTALGRPAKLAARLEGLADPNAILVDQNTYNLIHDYVSCEHVDQITPKELARPIQIYRVGDFISDDHLNKRQQLSRIG